MRVIISNSSSEPIYAQVMKQIKAQIIKGRLKEGQLLPSIRGLARDLQISVITTKRAYDELEKEGYLETVHGKGTYVAVQNRELMKEKKLRLIEEKLLEVIDEGRLFGFTYDEIKGMLEILYKGVD